VNKTLLDSVKQKADTIYSKRYRTEEFAEADYYVNKHDSTYCQVMKDTGGIIRQVIMAKKDIRFFTAEYYDNGQLKAKLPFDSKGKFDGPAEYYFENGCVMRSGSFVHGFFHGEWRNYDQKGNLVSIDTYDENGQLINPSSQK
jgi:antitoxin component YwqK of YwqJK toxin-antitoxin module